MLYSIKVLVCSLNIELDDKWKKEIQMGMIMILIQTWRYNTCSK